MTQLEKKLSDITIFELSEVIKKIFLEALVEHEERKALFRKKNRKMDENQISKSAAGRLRSPSRVQTLIDMGLLKTTSSGSARNSTVYVSKKQLFELDNIYL